MLYGHRQDVDGYAGALTQFDKWLGEFMPKLRDGDMMIITADHGCDPSDLSTDHTREYIPLAAYGKQILPVNLGVRATFADIAATVAEVFGVEYACRGESMLGELTDMREHIARSAIRAMKCSYSPYSGYRVGAALLGAGGPPRLDRHARQGRRHRNRAGGPLRGRRRRGGRGRLPGARKGRGRRAALDPRALALPDRHRVLHQGAVPQPGFRHRGMAVHRLQLISSPSPA